MSVSTIDLLVTEPKIEINDEANPKVVKSIDVELLEQVSYIKYPIHFQGGFKSMQMPL